MDCYIGIDQSYSGFGLSVLAPNGDHVTTVTAFTSAEFGAGIDRVTKISRWLAAQLTGTKTRYRVRHVCMEGYAYGAAQGREEAGELGVMVKSALRQILERPVCYPTIVPPSTLKKYVTGSGKAGKEEMLKGVMEKWDVDFTTRFTQGQAHNAADAYSLARLAMAMVRDPLDLAEMKIRDSLTPFTERPAIVH